MDRYVVDVWPEAPSLLNFPYELIESGNGLVLGSLVFRVVDSLAALLVQYVLYMSNSYFCVNFNAIAKPKYDGRTHG